MTAVQQTAVASPSAETSPRPIVMIERGDFSITFRAAGEHEAMRAAEEWLKARGFSVGTLQADAPSGVVFGDCTIAKWRNLDPEDLNDLHGQMRAPGRTWRTGPVTVVLRHDAPFVAIQAFRSEPEDAAAQNVVEGRQS